MKIKKFNFFSLLFLFSIFIYFSLNIKMVYANEYNLNELIENNKIEEIVKYNDYYQLKIKLSDIYKEIIEIPITNEEEVNLLKENFNLNSLIINDNNKNIVTENPISNDYIMPLEERLNKYKANNEISLSDLEIEIKEKNVKKIYKKENNEDDSSEEYTYSVLLKTLDDEILIDGDIETIDISDYINIIEKDDYYFIFITLGAFIVICIFGFASI